MTNQDPKYQAIRDELSESGSQNGPYQPYSSASFKSGADWATDYWSKRNEGEINRLTYELDKSRSSHCKIIEELEEKSKRMVPIEVVEKLVEAIEDIADTQRPLAKKIVYEVLALWDEWKEKK